MRTIVIAVVVAFNVVLGTTARVDAGCGCNKPPPPTASVRPAFASPGNTVTLISHEFENGKRYTVRFGDNTNPIDVQAISVRRRDLADKQLKNMVIVSAPAMRPGPTRIRVKETKDDWKDIDLNVPASSFTMLQAPLALAEGDGETVATCYSAAVGADGTVYFPVDISNIAQHMVFSGLAMNYPLLFAAQDIAIYNTQGFLMQLLGPDQSIYAIDDPAGAPNSLELVYDRHEFLTYRDQHAHLGGFGLDPLDRNWHLDGTYHVDHDHLVLAVRGVVQNQGVPAPGQTPPFELHVATALADGTNGVVTSRTIVWSDACSPAPTAGN